MSAFPDSFTAANAVTRTQCVSTATEVIASAAGRDFEIAIILGSGLGDLVDTVQTPVRIPYADLPGFPAPSVSAHAGEVIAGRLQGKRVLFFAGRAHFYENGDAAAMAVPIDVAAKLGCRTLILTNASGSLREDLPPGSVSVIRDHINFSGRNPLVGQEGDARFVDMSAAYDPALRQLAQDTSSAMGSALSESVYMWFSGPSFETPAEVRAAAVLGADLVGMSTVPEVILARHRGLRTLALSVITNYAAGLRDETLSHEQTKHVAREGAAKLARLLPPLIEAMPS